VAHRDADLCLAGRTLGMNAAPRSRQPDKGCAANLTAK
jgi:hypothetical protein